MPEALGIHQLIKEINELKKMIRSLQPNKVMISDDSKLLLPIREEKVKEHLSVAASKLFATKSVKIILT